MTWGFKETRGSGPLLVSSLREPTGSQNSSAAGPQGRAPVKGCSRDGMQGTGADPWVPAAKAGAASKGRGDADAGHKRQEESESRINMHLAGV